VAGPGLTDGTDVPRDDASHGVNREPPPLGAMAGRAAPPLAAPKL